MILQAKIKCPQNNIKFGTKVLCVVVIYNMIKLLIGGSPCTYWSIAQKNNRETEPNGLGWELFENYLIAKEKFKPDFFLYENNKSASNAIKGEIKNRLNVWDGSFFSEDTGVRYIEINSALVSAQNRQRFYVHNCGDVEQPTDRRIFMNDILDDKDFSPYNGGKFIRIKDDLEKNYNQSWQIGVTGKSGGQAVRVYDLKGKSVAIKSKAGGGGAKTGLYLTINGVKALSVSGVAKMQTMPSDYTKCVKDSIGISALGNGWTAEVIIHILNGAFRNVPKDTHIQVLSMYDGIGTGRYCLDKMGFTNVEYYASEIDKYAMQIAKSNYPDIRYIGDAYNVRNKDWSLEKYAK